MDAELGRLGFIQRAVICVKSLTQKLQGDRGDVLLLCDIHPRYARTTFFFSFFLSSDSPYTLWSQASSCPLLTLGPFVLFLHTEGAGPL